MQSESHHGLLDDFGDDNVVAHDLDRSEEGEDRLRHRFPADQKVRIVGDDGAIFRREDLRAGGDTVRELGSAFELLAPARTVEFVPSGGPIGRGAHLMRSRWRRAPARNRVRSRAR